MEKYKQLHDAKVTCEITADVLTDPLLEPDIVSVRLKPPMNTRGIRRMAFPCDVWITVCGPNNDYVIEIEQLLKGLQSDFATRTLSISKSSPLNSQIRKKEFREHFVKENHLFGVRWNPSSKKDFNKLTIWAAEEVFHNPSLMTVLQDASSTGAEGAEAEAGEDGNHGHSDGRDFDETPPGEFHSPVREAFDRYSASNKYSAAFQPSSEFFSVDSGLCETNSDSQSRPPTDRSTEEMPPAEAGFEFMLDEPVPDIAAMTEELHSSVVDDINQEESGMKVCYSYSEDFASNSWGL